MRPMAVAAALLLIGGAMIVLALPVEAVADASGIGLWADQPLRDRIIAGLAVLTLVATVMYAMYYIARKEGL